VATFGFTTKLTELWEVLDVEDVLNPTNPAFFKLKEVLNFCPTSVILPRYKAFQTEHNEEVFNTVADLSTFCPTEEQPERKLTESGDKSILRYTSGK
jgi:hypothetical protein